MNIREERKAARLSTRQLGRMIGVTPTAVTRWENGTTTVKPEIAESLAAIFAAAKRGTVDTNSTAFRVVEPRTCPRYEFPASAIANLAGVSPATVDNYRTERHPVSPKTRRKIERAIAKLRAGQTAPDLPPLAIPEPPRPMPPPTVLPAPTPSLWQRVGVAVRRVLGKS